MDYIFYRFDWTVLRKKGEVGGTVLPHQMLQLLRPVSVGLADFDRRFVEGFAIPQLRAVRSFSSDTSIRILSYLHNLKDVKEETAIKILADDYLHQAVRSIDPRAPEFAQAVDSVLTRENAELRIALDQTQREVAEVEQRRLEEVSIREHQMASKDVEIAKARSRLAEAQRSLQDEQSAKAEAIRLKEAEERQLREQLRASQRQQRIAQFAGAAAGMALIAIAFIAVPNAIGQGGLGSRNWYRAFGVGLFAMALVIMWAWLDRSNRKYSVPLVAVPFLVILGAIEQAVTGH